jgi:hypothetical protein
MAKNEKPEAPASTASAPSTVLLVSKHTGSLVMSSELKMYELEPGKPLEMPAEVWAKVQTQPAVVEWLQLGLVGEVK